MFRDGRRLVSKPGKLISLVIPVYNQLHYTKQCVEAIQRHTTIPYELILVDNASSDGTHEYLRTLKATIISNEKNLGCAKAWNQGIRASGGTMVAILNNDIVVTPGWLERLVAFMEATGHGLVSPSAREGKLDYDLIGYAQEFVRKCAGATREGAMYAACMLIRRDVFERIGMFDEGFSYGGCEDTDFLWRMKQAGFSVAMTGSVLIHHFSMVTQDAIKQSDEKAYPAENLAHFKKKWNRTVRGNWAERRWTNFKFAWLERYERVRFGHTLIEKCDQ